VPTATADWELWSTTARLVVTQPELLERARVIAESVLEAVEAASSRFRADSEVVTVESRLPDGVEVSPMLALLVERAIAAAVLTDGDVDPTLGRALGALGYDRDIRLVHDSDSDSDVIVRAIASPKPGWRELSLTNRELRLPAGMTLDLGATAKAVAADLVAEAVHRETGSGVLVSLGGDIATAGTGPEGGWMVLVQDLDTDPATTVRLSDGRALATSSTQRRRWTRGGESMHHIVDPRTGLPADAVWRSVSVCATSCLVANALSTASIVRGESAAHWLATLGVPARLVHRDGRILTLGGWPTEAPARSGRELSLVV
jgi:thiamine biosynthesis lipoprotein